MLYRFWRKKGLSELKYALFDLLMSLSLLSECGLHLYAFEVDESRIFI